MKKNKYTRKQRGGQTVEPPKSMPTSEKTQELTAILTNAYISMLEFVKNKMARFAGLEPIQEGENVGSSLVEKAEQGATVAMNGLNSVIQNPNIKKGLALASEKLATTLADIVKVAKEKLDNPEFKESLLTLVKFVANITTRFIDAMTPALNKTIDKYSEIFEKLIRKMSVAMGNALMNFLETIPFLGEGVAFVNLLHTFTMFFLSALDAFYKSMQTSANFVVEVADNLNLKMPSTDGLARIQNAIRPTIDNFTSVAKTKYQDLTKQSLPTLDDTASKSMKGGKKRIQKRIRKSIRDFLRTNKTRRHRKR